MGNAQGIGSARSVKRRPACLGDPYRINWSANNCLLTVTSVTAGYRTIDPMGTFAWVLLGACDFHKKAIRKYAGEFRSPVESVALDDVPDLVKRVLAEDVPPAEVLWLDRLAG